MRIGSVDTRIHAPSTDSPRARHAAFAVVGRGHVAAID